jgi:ABC-2 type transport system permease protein
MTTPAKVWSYRTLIGNLALRDLRSRYKKSVLGWMWSLINPAVTLGIYTVVFGVFLGGNANAPTAGNHRTHSFALFLFCGLVAWNAFANGVNQSISSFLGAGPMLTRSYFPPESPILASTLTSMTQTVLEASILVGFMFALGNAGWSLLLIPAILVMLATTALGLGMLVSLLNVRYRDINYLVGIALQLLFYATPIVYALDRVAGRKVLGVDASRVLVYNPMTHFVEAMRAVAYLQRAPSAQNWFVMVASATISLVLGWSVFSRKAPLFIEEI